MSVRPWLLCCVLGTFSAGCAASPRHVPRDLLVAAFQYQLDAQVPKSVSDVYVLLINPLRNETVPQNVFRRLRGGDRELVRAWHKRVPEAVLQVETQAERAYPNSYVLLGLIEVPSQGISQAYRYRFDRDSSGWHYVWDLPVEVNTDHYGNYWVTGDRDP